MDWHHAPAHYIDEAGAYCVTASTLHKEKLFHSRKRLDMLQEKLFAFAASYGWLLQAWSFFPNHYHFVATSPEAGGETLRRWLADLHSATGRELNRMDGVPGRKVWFQYWDKHLTYHGSYIARLRYVHENAVHHGIVLNAVNYRWCSASWFVREGDSAFVKGVMNCGIARLSMVDDF